MQLGLMQKARTRSFEELKASAIFTQTMRVKACPLPPRSSKGCRRKAVTIPEDCSTPAARPGTRGLGHPYKQGEGGDTERPRCPVRRPGLQLSSTERSCPMSQGPSSWPGQAAHLRTSKRALLTIPFASCARCGLVAARRFPDSRVPLKSSPCSSSVQLSTSVRDG